MIADLTSKPIVWIEIRLKGYEGTQNQRELAMCLLFHRFLHWTVAQHLTPVTKGPAGVLGWRDGWDKKDAEQVIAWLRRQPELA